MNRLNTRAMVFTALMAAVICVLSPLTIPIGPVPITLQILAVLLAVYLLGAKYGTLSYLIYLFVGLLGVPVFSGFQGGFQKLAGPTGGYLIGMILTAAVAGWFIDRFPDRIVWQASGILLGIFLCYLVGTVWLMVVTKMDVGPALMAGVIPFIPLDLIKMAVAMAIGQQVRKRIRPFVQLA